MTFGGFFGAESMLHTLTFTWSMNEAASQLELKNHL